MITGALLEPVVDPEEGPDWPAPPPPILDQTEAQRTEKTFFGDCPPTPPSKGLDDRSPYLKVWIWHCSKYNKYYKVT